MSFSPHQWHSASDHACSIAIIVFLWFSCCPLHADLGNKVIIVFMDFWGNTYKLLYGIWWCFLKELDWCQIKGSGSEEIPLVVIGSGEASVGARRAGGEREQIETIDPPLLLILTHQNVITTSFYRSIISHTPKPSLSFSLILRLLQPVPTPTLQGCHKREKCISYLLRHPTIPLQ